MFAPNLLAQSDPELWNAIRLENQRQEDHVELIASENYVSRQVLIAQGSQLTNKYAEGYPGRRYYGGCEYVDIAETIAIERAKRLFGAPWANVQPESFLLMMQHQELRGMTAPTLRALWRARLLINSAFRKDPTARLLFL